MARSTRVPLHLFEVLEEEFITLHGAPAESTTFFVELPDASSPHQFRSVAASLNWNFHPSHIKNPRSFAASFATPAGEKNLTLGVRIPGELFSYDWTKNNLVEYLRGRIDPALLDALAAMLTDQNSAPPNLLDWMSSELNKLLEDKNLFDEERFSNYWLGPASKALIESRESAEFEGDDLLHFNRLLLEDAFPHALEKIHNIRLAAVYKRSHQVKPVALSLSGGGIRSGTFALGLLQGLARHDLLDKFHYLSTVSGGGYIGGWLAAWIHRHPHGLKGVTYDLANSNPHRKVDPDPPPVRYLRRYSSFITPKVGLLTADTWTFVGIYLRNLFLNWIVFIPLLLSVLMLPRLIVAITNAQPQNTTLFTLSLFGYSFAVFGRHFFLIAGFVLTVWVLAYIIFNRPTLREQLRQNSGFWRQRSNQRSFLCWCLLPLVVGAFCLTTYWSWSTQESSPKEWKHFLIFGVAVSLLAWLVASIVLGRVKQVMLPKNWAGIGGRETLALLLAGLIGGVVLRFITLAFAPIPDDPDFAYHFWSTGDEWTWITWQAELYACFAVPMFLLVFLLAITLFVGGSSVSSRIDDEDREWWSRLGAWTLIAILGWSVASGLTIFGPILLLSAPKLLASIGGISGLAAAFLGQSAKTHGTSKSKTQESRGLLSSLSGFLLPLLATVFIGLLIVSFSLATTGILQRLALGIEALKWPDSVTEWLTNTPDSSFFSYLKYIFYNIIGQDDFVKAKLAHMNVVHHSSFLFVFGVAAALFVFGVVVSWLINLNIFSLHGGYRNRIIRAFLGASRPDRQRRPNPFTGFDPADNVAMHELRVGLFDETDFPDPIALAAALLDKGNKASAYLASKDLLSNLGAVSNTTSISIRLVAALRKDLNGALHDLDLYQQPFARETPPLDEALKKADLIQSKEQEVLPEDELSRTASHIYLNRRALEKAYPGLIRPARPTAPYRLMPVINTTLNLVGGDNLAWQQRKAEPFSVTPLHSGCFRLGYRDSRLYGGSDTGGISIGTAAAISGAAASSNMGYYTSSAVLSLVLTFFNVRLGWWLGNPGTAGNDTFELRAPRSSVLPIVEEAFGLTDDLNKYVYLTDGGHFENLGLYEMILRRCHIVVLSDAAADSEYRFGDLGNAIRKVRIDLGVPIEFTALPIFSGWPDLKDKGAHWAIGKIRYSCIDGPNAKDGLLLYIKPAIYGDEPRDVMEYKLSHPEFPHQSTADQFFDEPQFESYRILGSYVMDQLLGSGPDPLTLDKAINNAVEKLTTDNGKGAFDAELASWAANWNQPQQPQP